jgi:hypothetical protein
MPYLMNSNHLKLAMEKDLTLRKAWWRKSLLGIVLGGWGFKAQVSC